MGTQCGEEDLRLLRSLPTASVDLVYLDPPFFSSWAPEGSWAYRAQPDFSEDRWQGGVRTYLDWTAAAIEDMHRVLKPTGALFLVCDELVGLYVRFLLDQLIGPRDVHNRMAWRKVDSGPEHHYVFQYHRSAEIRRHGHLYTVIRRQRQVDWSLVAFSFVQGRRKPSVHL